MLSEEQGEEIVKYTREVLEKHVRGEESPEAPEEDFFQERKGVFVTLKKKGELRGCIGIPKPEYELGEAVKRAARSATDDPRFSSLREEELDDTTVEVTVLTKPEKIEVGEPEEYLEKVEVGRDGLIAKRGLRQGLLLPQVPLEQDWEVEEFLEGVCRKAGLPVNAWKKTSTELLKFQGQVFGEKEPDGEPEERSLGS
ncbi:MAG: TIGR00296 family protein [Candidatus Aenigmatarchaeota archaeon]